MKRIVAILVLLALITTMAGVFLTGCVTGESFVILSGSENEALEPILEEFGKQNHVKIEMVYPCWTRTNSRGLRAGRDASGLKPAPVASALGLLRLAESPTGRAQLRNR